MTIYKTIQSNSNVGTHEMQPLIFATRKSDIKLFIFLIFLDFNVLSRNCKGYITMGSFKGRGNQEGSYLSIPYHIGLVCMGLIFSVNFDFADTIQVLISLQCP